MNIELIPNRGSWDVIESCDLPTLPTPGQEVCGTTATYKVVEAIWHPGSPCQGVCVVIKTSGD